MRQLYVGTLIRAYFNTCHAVRLLVAWKWPDYADTGRSKLRRFSTPNGRYRCIAARDGRTISAEKAASLRDDGGMHGCRRLPAIRIVHLPQGVGLRRHRTAVPKTIWSCFYRRRP